MAHGWVATTAVDNGTILVLITLVVLPIAAVAFARSGPGWRRLGKGAFAIEQRTGPPDDPARVDPAIQAAEARQMLEARSYRQVRSGREPIDVEAEMRRLLEDQGTRPTVDDELREEVRRLVVAGNERRLRRGEAPLDVEAETERQLADFIGSG
jgi:hypothetical protein